MWERACSRNRSVSHRIYRLNHRIRGQAPSHICFCVAWKTRLALLTAYASLKPCTTPLWERACSRKRCVSHRIYRLNHRLRGQAHSHICCVLLERPGQHTCLLTHRSNLALAPCGSGLARESAVSVTEFIDSTTAFRVKPPSHICFCVAWKIRLALLTAYASLKPCTNPLWERACS